MAKKEREARPVAAFCGRVALLQISRNLHYIVEQPYPSSLFEVQPWPKVLKDPRTSREIYHRCMHGLRVMRGPYKGLAIRKPSSMTASHPALVYYFRNKRCRELHEHLSMDGHPKELAEAQLWTWSEAKAIVNGIILCRKEERVSQKRAYSISQSVNLVGTFPVLDVTTIPQAQPPDDHWPGGKEPRGEDPRAPRRYESKCSACRTSKPNNHWGHTRIIGECAYPYHKPMIPTCPGCLRIPERPKDWAGEDCHTKQPGCRWATATTRAPHTRARHPRDPSGIPELDQAVGNLPGSSHGRELAKEAEDTVDQDQTPESREVGTETRERTAPEPGASSSSSRIPRGPDTVPRHRSEAVKTSEAGVGPSNSADWRHFDIRRVLRVLQMGTMTQAELTIRKLHIRWYHASKDTMYKLLERCGVPKSILNRIAPIVLACSVCRKWHRPGPSNVASAEMADEFNQQVECDLMFMGDWQIFHMIDRCTRWYLGVITPGKHDDEIQDGLDEWFKVHGWPKEIISDPERGVVSKSTQEWLARKGITYVPRAKKQQVPHIDRRGALVRDVIHKMVDQLKVEGIKMPFKQILAEAVFITNAMLTINNTSPYAAVYGRVPQILPDINSFDMDPATTTFAPTIRCAQRLREVAVQAIIQQTAYERAQRALSTRSVPAGELLGLKIGDLIDFHRNQPTKDISGWSGPAKVIDVTEIGHGTITVRYASRPFECRLQDVRRHLAFLVFLAAGHSVFYKEHQLFLKIRASVDALQRGKAVLVGKVLSSGVWCNSQSMHTHSQLWQMAVHFARTSLSTNCDTIRVGWACQSIGALKGYRTATTLWWLPGRTPHEIHQVGPTNTINFASLESDWAHVRFVQFLHSTATGKSIPIRDEDVKQEPQPEVQQPANEGPLPTIPEVDEDNLSDSLWTHEDPDPKVQQALKYASQFLEDDFDDAGVSDANLFVTDHDTDPLSCLAYPNDSLSYLLPLQESDNTYHLIAANVRAGLPPNFALDEEEPYVELMYEGPAWKLAWQEELPHQEPDEGSHLVTRMYLSKHKVVGQKKVSVERDDALLTPEEVKQHWQEVLAAIQKELETWVDMECISRKPRAQARNIIDCKWVLKWKWETPAQAASDTTTAVKRRVIRARLCLRGFKDIQSNDLASYAGTSSRYSQRLLVSEAVMRGWDLATTDISKAFLQGVTYKELAELTGEPLREVNFYLPDYCVPFLAKLKGFGGFDPRTEVIHCDKPGTGCVDAPRCFSLKLAKVTKDMCGMTQCTIDNELCFLHKSGSERTAPKGSTLELLAVMAKHVDDLKLTGQRQTLIWILQQVEKVFGKLKIEWNNFTNCGIRHIQNVETKEVSMDQTEYIKGVKTISHPDISSKGAEELCCTELHHMFWSILGAIAFATLTRVDILVFVSALQRFSHAPKIIHVKRLNAVVRWAQRNPKRLLYRRFKSLVSHLRQYGDAAFKKEDDSGHSMRGALYIRCNGNQWSEFQVTTVGHLIHFSGNRQRRVVRATFSAELMNACDTQDTCFLIAQAMHEMVTGDTSAACARNNRDNGGYKVPMVLLIDAMSVYAAITATFVKTPAESGVLCHLLFLRELLDKGILEALGWCDTRDMLADGMTKGAVDRDALHNVMEGEVSVKYPLKLWRPSNRAK